MGTPTEPRPCDWYGCDLPAVLDGLCRRHFEKDYAIQQAELERRRGS